MQIETKYYAGAHIIVGNYPEPGLSVGLKDPWDNTYISTTGAKAEHGPGGFEFLAPNAGTPYTMTIAGEAWEFAHRTGVTQIVFIEGEPEPPVEPPVEPEDPCIPCEVAQDVIDRLDAVIAILEPYCEA